MFGILALGGAVAIVRAIKRHSMSSAIARLQGFQASQEFLGADSKTGMALDEARRQVCLVAFGSPSEARVLSYDEIIQAEVLEDGEAVTSTSGASQVGRGVVGGALFGPVGLLAGVLSAAKTSSTKVNRLDLKLVLADTARPVHIINFLVGPKQKSDSVYKAAEKEVRAWHGRMLALIRQSQVVAPAHSAAPQMGSRADELTKLAKLREDGILTQAEFDAEKARVLGQRPAGTA